MCLFNNEESIEKNSQNKCNSSEARTSSEDRRCLMVETNEENEVTSTSFCASSSKSSYSSFSGNHEEAFHQMLSDFENIQKEHTQFKTENCQVHKDNLLMTEELKSLIRRVRKIKDRKYSIKRRV